jgi:hypothetical protein
LSEKLNTFPEMNEEEKKVFDEKTQKFDIEMKTVEEKMNELQKELDKQNKNVVF